MRPRLLALLAIGALAGACDSPTGSATHDPFSPAGLGTGVDGTVRWNGIEGGFWTVRLTDGRILDPHASLPEAYRVGGLQVRLSATARPGVACLHQAGIIVEITHIQSR
jgi:hypothetical protein